MIQVTLTKTLANILALVAVCASFTMSAVAAENQSDKSGLRGSLIQAIAYQDPNGPHALFGDPFSDEAVGSAIQKAVPPLPSDTMSYPNATPTQSGVVVPSQSPIVTPAPAVISTPPPSIPIATPNYRVATPSNSVPVSPSCGVAAPSCGAAAPSCGVAAPSCGASACSPCGQENGCTCGGGCGSSCSLGLCNCELGDAFSISGLLHGECPPCVTIGGWLSSGYHTEGNGLFNSRPDNLAVHQAWLYAEKVADASSPFGFRADVMYGIDANDTQAFGNPTGSWDFDNGFDHGAYGWAIPQAYGELALGENLTIKAGHFFTLIGYEVVTAPDNFFYSHAMTMYNSEPFTHTGVMATATMSDNLTVYGGWTLGWDTGFDQLNDGSSFLGGASLGLGDDVTMTYMATAGNFGWRGDEAYSHSVVFDVSMTDKLNWIVQSDLLRVDSTGEDNVGVNQYFLYSISDCLGLGARMEWWKGDVQTGYAPHGAVLPAAGSLSYYAATFGANIRPHANLVIRPEVRIDWSPAANYDESYFGIDAIMTF